MAPAQTPAPSPPVFFVPSPKDSLPEEVPPAPLLVPGRPYEADTLKRSAAQVAREFLLKGQVLEHDGNPEAATMAYRNALMLDPRIRGANYRLGKIYEAFGANAEAMKAFAAEVQNHPDEIEAARSLGVSLARLGESERAIQQLELLVRRNSRDGESWRALSFAYTLARRFPDAERAIRNAIAIPPPDAEEYRDLGVLLANQGREREARDAYRKAASLDPRDATAVINLGNMELRAGRPGPALERYREAERRDTTNVFAYRAQVQALASLGRDAESGDVYRRWLRCVPDDETARLDAVQYFAERGRRDIALELAREGLRRSPRSGYAHMTMGVALGLNGDARNALQELRVAERTLVRIDAAGNAKAQALITELRAGAPDSLRGIFVDDSLKFEVERPLRMPLGAAPNDSTRAGAR